MAKLIVNPTSPSRRELALSRALVSIGRDPSNDVVLPDAMVSRRHAVIEYRGSQYFLRDCNSSNGSLINGDRISERGLRDGDLVAIGTARLLFRDDVVTEDAAGKVIHHPSSPRQQCPTCRQDYRKGDQFCRHCGSSLAPHAPVRTICPACGTAVPVPARFCTACGARLGEGDDEDQPAALALAASGPAEAEPSHLVEHGGPPHDPAELPPVDGALVSLPEAPETIEPVLAEDAAAVGDATEPPPGPEPPLHLESAIAEVPAPMPPLPMPASAEAMPAVPWLSAAAPLPAAPRSSLPGTLIPQPSPVAAASSAPTPWPMEGQRGDTYVQERSAPAGAMARLGAFLVDLLIVGLVQTALSLPAVFYWLNGARRAEEPPSDVSFLPILLSVTLATLAAILSGVYYVYFWGLKGATPGKRLFGLVVEGQDGRRPVGPSRAALRLLGYGVSGLVFGIGFLMIAFGGNGLHDQIAGTRVMRRPGA